MPTGIPFVKRDELAPGRQQPLGELSRSRPDLERADTGLEAGGRDHERRAALGPKRPRWARPAPDGLEVLGCDLLALPALFCVAGVALLGGEALRGAHGAMIVLRLLRPRARRCDPHRRAPCTGRGMAVAPARARGGSARGAPPQPRTKTRPLPGQEPGLLKCRAELSTFATGARRLV